MKGLSRKNFSQAGHRSMIGSLQLATQGPRSGSTTGATPVAQSLKLAEISQVPLAGSQSTQHSRSCSTLTLTPLIDRFLLFFSATAIVVVVVRLKLPTMVLFVTPAPQGWADDYFWLCVGAYSSDWSSALFCFARTPAPLILTHDPYVFAQKALTVQQAARVSN